MFEKEVPTVILSGGQSRRMDRNDKALLSIEDQTLLEIVIIASFIGSGSISLPLLNGTVFFK